MATVLSLSRVDPFRTDADVVHYLVTFSEAVTGVDAHSFTLTSSGVTGASIVGVSEIAGSSQQQYEVSVETGSGDGEISLRVSGAGIANVSNGFGLSIFGPPISFAGGFGNGIALANIDSGDTLDLLRASGALLGNGDGTFGPLIPYPAGGSLFQSITAADVNGDSKTDIVGTNFTSQSISLLIGNGDGTFQAPMNFSVGDSPSQTIVFDLDGNGFQDILIANAGTKSVSVFLQNPDHTFQPQHTYSAGASLFTFTLGDVNSDNKPDLLAGRSILLGNGDGTFQQPPLDTGFIDTWGMADFNGDGKLDLLVNPAVNPNSIAVKFGNGDGTFQAPVITPVPVFQRLTAIADVNADGRMDVVGASSPSGGGAVLVLLGDGDGHFLSHTNYDQSGAYATAVGDINGDGFLDLATSVSNKVNFQQPVAASYEIDKAPFDIALPNDFNGDHKADILWREDGGSTRMWEMNGGEVLANLDLSNVPPAWKIVGTGDFNSDGLGGDIVWRDNTGNLTIWEMDGGNLLATLNLGNVPTNWTMVGTGDFNRDGVSDLLWRDQSGGVQLWEMTGAPPGNQQLLASIGLSTVPTNWHITGLGDFNNDGTSDILWRGDDGHLLLWEMSGAPLGDNQLLANIDLGTVPTNFHVAGTGDFNHDGRSDILWRADDGHLTLWEMTGAPAGGNQLLANIDLGPMGNEWHIASVRDLNGDGNSDIVWRHDNGATRLWEMDGGAVTANLDLSIVGPNWHVVDNVYLFV